MARHRAKVLRLVLYVLILWILAWSLYRMLRYRPELATSGHGGSLGYWPLFIATGVLTAGWAVGGLLMLTRWHEVGGAVVRFTQRSRVAYWSVWLVPALLWTLGFALFQLGMPLPDSLMDGPALVLAIGGLAALLYLVKHFYAESGEDERDLSDEPPRSAGLETQAPWVPAGLVTPAAILVLAVTALLVFRDSLFDPQSIVFGDDVLKQHYMFEWFVRETLLAGQLPLWNPYIFSGSPALSHPQYLVFYPPQMLLRLLPLNLSQSWAIAIHVCLAGIGMFALCRRLRLQPWISLTCGLVYMLNSGLLLRVYSGQVQMVFALAWFPLVWLLIMIALDTGRTPALVSAALGLAMIILTGHPPFPLYMFLFFGLYWAYVCWRMWSQMGSRRLIGQVTARFVAVVVLGIGLSAIQLVPSSVMAGQASLAGGYEPSKANMLALSTPELLAILLPRFYTTPEKWWFYWELVPYMGILFILTLPFLYAARARDSLICFLGAVALASLALAFGESVGLYSLLHTIVPLFRLSRIPPRALVLWIPAIVVLGGMGLQALSGRSVAKKWLALGTRTYVVSSLFPLGCAVGHWLNQTTSLSDRLSPAGLLSAQLALAGLASVLVVILFGTRLPLQRHPVRRFLALTVTTGLGCLFGLLVFPSYLPFTGRLLVLGLLIAANVVLLNLLYKRGPAPLSVVSLIAVVCLDLGLFGVMHIAPVSSPSFYEDERVVLRSVELQGLGRVLSTGGSPDKFMLGHANHVDGYASGILQGYDAFLRFNSEGPPTDTSYILAADSTVDRGVLDFLGVEYIIDPAPNNDDRLELVASQDGHHLFRNPSALPRAFVVYDVQVVRLEDAALEALKDKEFDYARSVVLSEAPETDPGPPGVAAVSIDEHVPTSGSLVMTVQTSEPGILVMSEPYYSERRVWVDGEEEELLRANVGFSAVSLSSGVHTVELRYVPASFYAGASITALAILTCIALLLFSRVYSRRSEETRERAGIQKQDLGSTF